jgi:Zn-dependent protease with chaperone function
MQAFPDPVSDATALEAGLAAIKQGEYCRSITALEQYLASTPEKDCPNALKAQMGLVMAYSRSERISDAIALCQTLSQTQNRKIQDWAIRTLADLEGELNRAPNQCEPNSNSELNRKSEEAGTGFTPLASFSTVESFGKAPRRPVKLPSANSPQPTFRATPVRETPVSAPTQEPTSPTPSLSAPKSTPSSFIPPPSSLSSPHPSTWRNAARSQRWQPLTPLNSARLQWAEMGTIAALFFILCSMFAFPIAVEAVWLRFATRFLKWSAYIPPISAPFWFIVLGLIGLFIASPWILDCLLKCRYGLRSLPTTTLARYSAESHRLLTRFCQQRQIPLLKLGILPTEAPLAFTYGSHPKVARIVVSQGLLDRLADDEIAAIYASELGHIAHWNFCLMSLVAVVVQLPYTLYWQAATVTDWLQTRAKAAKKETHWIAKSIALLLRVGATLSVLISAISYGIYRLLRWSGLWLSKARSRYSNRYACNLTGNPNGLARALLKYTIGTTQVIQQQAKTDYLLEGFELLTPVGYRAALHLGSFFDHTSLKSLLLWEQVNPDRYWLALNNSHALMGDRLRQLMQDADYWQLERELELEPAPAMRIKPRYLLQGAPIWGIGIGYAIAQLLWIVAHLAYRLGSQHLNWLATDFKLFSSFMLIGFGIGTIVRFNRFFPDIQTLEGKPTSPESDGSSSLLDLITSPQAVPIESYPIRLEGRLIGRGGASNCLGQDLMLQTATGLIQLHYLSQFGVIGNVIPQPVRPVDLLQQSIVITGWFRRGATPWIDVNTFKTINGRTCRSGHQVWSTLLAMMSILIGTLLIL